MFWNHLRIIVILELVHILIIIHTSKPTSISLSTYHIMRLTSEVASLGQQYDGDNDTVDGDGLTEDHTDQVLRLDTRHLDCTTQQRTACDEDTPNR